LKVAVFFTWDYSLKTWDESGTINRELKFFKKIQNEKNIAFSFFTYGTSSDFKLGNKHNLSEIHPVYDASIYLKNKLLRIASSVFLPFKLRKKLDNVDIVFQNQLLGSWIPILIKHIYKKPLIIRTGYDMLEFAKKDKKSSFIIFLYKILTSFAVKNCDYLTVTSEVDLKRFQIKYPKYEKKFLLRPNWIQVDELNTLTNRHNNKLLTVGRLVTQKNFSYLISEFKNTESYLEIDIVGDGPDREKLIEEAKKQKVKLNLLGSLQNEELLKLYKEYKFFISTSLFEGNPKSLLEAMGSGCIVIASEINNHIEIVSDFKNGFLFEIKKNNLLEKFELIYENDELIKTISKNAYLSVRDTNSLDKSINLFFQDFEKTLAK